MHLWRYFGASWLAYRLGYALRIHSGWLRHQIPSTSWERQPLCKFLTDTSLAEPDLYLDWRKKHSTKFLFDPANRLAFQSYFERWDLDHNNPCQIAEGLLGGVFRYFSHISIQVGRPPSWHQNPFTGQSLPPDLHWSQIDDSDYGDIKVIWDLSRFGFVYTLVRAYWRTGDERYPELFWQLIEDWQRHNLPQQGANWKCGQEISFRALAWCFGLYGFLYSPATTAGRVVVLAQMLAVSGRRIEANFNYALSQRNNHGVSEGMGLWTIGFLFPEFRSSSRWLRKGREVLEHLGRDLIYDDGSFSQHSANYQRLVLHNYLWVLRLGELNAQPLSQGLYERVKQAGIFLYQAQDESSGCLPCFGHNDGSLVISLNNCDYRDFRPVIQATSVLTSNVRCYQDGPWDEDLLWLLGPQALQVTVNSTERNDFQAKFGGFYTLRSRSGFTFTHCGAYCHRPAHADMLHVDIWWRGQNIALDPGTYSYNAPPPWSNPFSNTSVHNVVTVDGRDQMERVGRFLWLPWIKGTASKCQRSTRKLLAYWEGEHDGYQRLPQPVRVRRGILQLEDEYWLILDQLDSDQEHTYRLHWLFPDLLQYWNEETGKIVLETPHGKYSVQIFSSGESTYTLVSASDQSPRGWQSPYYYHREPALSVDCTVRAKSHLFYTLFGPDPCGLVIQDEVIQVNTLQGEAVLKMSPGDPYKLMQFVSWDGNQKDRLEVG